jgi:hypothetical protein
VEGCEEVGVTDSALTIDPAEFADRLELFFGDASDTVCRVYARLPGVTESGLTLSGHLAGPNCAYADTLPARFALSDRGPGAGLLAAATVPEPCFWTPDMPHLYRATVELRRGDKVLASVTRDIGLRTLGAASGKLYYDAKRWVLRGVRMDSVPLTDLKEWRELQTTLVVRNPSEDLCRQASEVGVLLVAELDSHDEDSIRRLARWAAVGMVVLPADPRHERAALRSLGQNLLFAERLVTGDELRPSAWADVAFCELDSSAEVATRIQKCQAAIIAVAEPTEYTNLEVARSACDQLQRQLAGHDRWAGYVA